VLRNNNNNLPSMMQVTSKRNITNHITNSSTKVNNSPISMRKERERLSYVPVSRRVQNAQT